MTRNRSYHPVTGRLYRLLTTMLTIVGMAILCVLGVSCELTEGTLLPSSEEDGIENTGEEDFDPYVLAIKFWEDDIYQNEGVFVDFVEEVDGLNMTQTELLVGEIDRLVAELNPSTARLSENIHVYWDNWPSGKYPSAVYVTTSCGGDNDIGCRYHNVTNAYTNPGGLWFETNSAVVYGIAAAQNQPYEITAYSITTNNIVRVCIGVGSSNYWFVNSMKNYFWGGLSINP